MPLDLSSTPPWPMRKPEAAAAGLNRIIMTPGTVPPAFSPCDPLMRESWARGIDAHSASFKNVFASPMSRATTSLGTSRSFASTVPALRPPPEPLDRCVLGWPDPHSAGVRPYIGARNFNSYCTSKPISPVRLNDKTWGTLELKW